MEYFRENKHDFRKGPTEIRPWSAFLQNVLFWGKANSELSTFKKNRIGSISKKLQDFKVGQISDIFSKNLKFGFLKIGKLKNRKSNILIFKIC